MTDGGSIVLKGVPEHVQEIADLIDKYIPGKIVWDQHAEPSPSGIIVLKGWDASRAESGEINEAA